jgi:hypothetical protein
MKSFSVSMNKLLNFDSMSLCPALTHKGLVKGGERIAEISMRELEHGTTSSYRPCINCTGHDTLLMCVMFGNTHESISVKMKFGRLLIAEKQRTPLATGTINRAPPKSLHVGCDAKCMAGVEPVAEPIDFPRIIMSSPFRNGELNLLSPGSGCPLQVGAGHGRPGRAPGRCCWRGACRGVWGYDGGAGGGGGGARARPAAGRTHIHSHLNLNSLSKSIFNTNLSDPIPPDYGEGRHFGARLNPSAWWAD